MRGREDCRQKRRRLVMVVRQPVSGEGRGKRSKSGLQNADNSRKKRRMREVSSLLFGRIGKDERRTSVKSG
ncbi:hypothetical protein SLA2020_237610 [Shorea laevis]